jgi:transposase-like protein
MKNGADESLILKEQAELEAAPFLFSEAELPSKIDKAKPKSHCTGEWLFRDDPYRYKAVVKLLAEPGVSVRTICSELNVSDHTVRSVAAREKISVAAVKKEVLCNIAHGLRLASERVIELMPEAGARDSLIGVGILSDKLALLSGEPTVRIDVQHFDLGTELQRLHAEVEKTIKQARVTEIPAQTDVTAKNGEQRALMNGDHDEQLGDVVRTPINLDEGAE